LLLRMLEKHFKNWIVPTFRRAGKYHGWYDDSAAGHEKLRGSRRFRMRHVQPSARVTLPSLSASQIRPLLNGMGV